MQREAIFIGYRRDDTADVAGRIYDAMAARFGRDRIFKDVDNLRPGANFGEYIRTVLPRCRVALVLIGPNWIDASDENGRRRLDDPHDWVRIEIEVALGAADLQVVPVLVNGARMPRGDELPRSLHPLLRRHAAIVRRDPDFHDDVARLASALRATVTPGIINLSADGRAGEKSVQTGGLQIRQTDLFPIIAAGVVLCWYFLAQAVPVGLVGKLVYASAAWLGVIWLYGAIVFPLRDFMLIRSLSVAFQRYATVGALIGVTILSIYALGFAAGLFPNDNLALTTLLVSCVWLAITAIALAIYAALAAKRRKSIARLVRVGGEGRNGSPDQHAGAKYDPLRAHLTQRLGEPTTLTFGEIERIIDAPLPTSAMDRTWWANTAHPSRVQARAWMDAGYLVRSVDLQARLVTFECAGVRGP